MLSIFTVTTPAELLLNANPESTSNCIVVIPEVEKLVTGSFISSTVIAALEEPRINLPPGVVPSPSRNSPVTVS